EVAELLVEAGTEGVKVNAPIARLKGEDGAASSGPAAAPSAASKGGDEKKAPETAAPEPEGEGPAPVTPKEELKDPEIPTDAKRVKTTVRDALRDAMAEEMRRDEAVFLM